MTDRRSGEEVSERETAPESARDEPTEGDGTEPPEGAVPAKPDCVDGAAIDEHVEELPDGAGCTEIWEHLSERRADDD